MAWKWLDSNKIANMKREKNGNPNDMYTKNIVGYIGNVFITTHMAEKTIT